MTFHKNLPAPATGDRDTDMQTSTQDSTNAGVEKGFRKNRNHPILLRPILPRPILPPPTLPTPFLPMPTLPPPILPTPFLPMPTLPPPTLPPPTLPTPAFVQFPPREPDLYDEVMAIVPPKKSKNLPNSILGKKKAMLGDRMGTDHRERLEIRWEGTTMLGNIDGEYKPAVWHEKIRDKLILIDAQQPGAPVWRPGMSLDYTSYSPFTSDWIDDPATVLDGRGRQVCLMDEPPKDWQHNPKRPYLMFEGKFVLDVNNRPIKDYKEAPLSISIEARPSLWEGLYRTLGMTKSDIRARMRPIRFTSKGPQLTQSNSLFTNHRNDWKKEKGMKQWHSKAPKKIKKTKKDKNKVKDEDKVKEEEKAYPLPESMDTDDTGLTLANRLLSTMPGPSSAMTASNGLSQHETEQSSPPLLQTGRYDFAGARDISSGPYYGGQSNYAEQSRGGTRTNASTVPAANMRMSNTSSTTTGYINAPGYPSRFSHQNIYPGQGPMSAGAYPYGQPTTGYGEQSLRGSWANAPTFSGANIPAQNTNNVGPGNLNTSGYPLVSAPQNMYGSAAPNFDLSTVYTPPIYNTTYNQRTDPALYSTHVRAPTHSVPRPVLGGFNRPDPNSRYEVDDFWDQELARHESLATNFSAQVQATPQPAGPPRPQPLGAALPAPVQLAENANASLSSPAEDPFLGAEYSPVSPEDWLDSDELWHGDR